MPSPDQYRALRERAGLVDRSSRGRLMVSGQDRLGYLQGLLTNDVAALTPGTGCYAAYLTAQGRMIADMRLFETGDALVVDLDGRLAATVAERWDMFVFSEDVKITDVSSTLAQVGIYGPAAGRILAEVLKAPHSAELEQFDALPMPGIAVRDFGDTRVYVLHGDDVGVPGFDVVLPAGMKEPFESELQRRGAMPVDPETVEATRIEAGRALFGVDMTEDTIPLEAGITDRAISLTKGCYVGQEVIIRVLHRGHGRVAKRLVGLALEPDAAVPASGTKLTSGEREIGSITSAVRSPALGYPIALAYVHRDFAEAGTSVAVGGDATTAATVRLLPFVSSV